MAIRTDGGDRLEVIADPAPEGDLFLTVEFGDDTPILARGSIRQPITELRLRPSQAERLIDELRLVLGPRPLQGEDAR